MKNEKLEMLKVTDRHFLFAMITALANRMQSVGDTFFDEMTWKQWFVLLGASVFESPPAITQVAALIGTSHQNAKQLLLRLQKAGFVSLEKDPMDQRRTLVHFAEKFFEFERTYREDSQEFIHAIYEGISEEEVRTARRVLTAIDDNLMKLSAYQARTGGKK